MGKSAGLIHRAGGLLLGIWIGLRRGCCDVRYELLQLLLEPLSAAGSTAGNVHCRHGQRHYRGRIHRNAAQSGSAAQINAVLPSNTPVGTGTLTVSYNGANSVPVPITVVQSSFGTFTWTGAGTGPGIFTNAVTYAFYTPFTSAKPSTSAGAGDYVTIWGTGLGPASSASAEQSAAPSSADQCPGAFPCPTVYVGGKQATVTYAGRSGYTALDQIDFIVPTNVQGCYLPVAVVTGSVTSNLNSISVTPVGIPAPMPMGSA